MTYRATVTTAMINNGIPVLLYVVGAILLVAISKNSSTTIIILLLSGMLFLPGPIILHINYWTLDKNLILNVGNGIEIVNEKTHKRVEFDLSDIMEIRTVVTSSIGSPWNMNEYTVIKLHSGDFITLTNYIIGGSTLVELVKRKNLRIGKQRFFPAVEDHLLSELDRALRTTQCIPNSARNLKE